MRENSKLNLALKLVKISLVVDVSKLLWHCSNILFDSFLYRYTTSMLILMLWNDSAASMGLVLPLQVHKEWVGKTGFCEKTNSTISLIRAFQRPSEKHAIIGLSHTTYEGFWYSFMAWFDHFLVYCWRVWIWRILEFHVPTINSIGFTMGCLDGNLSIRLSQTTHWLSTSRFLAW